MGDIPDIVEHMMRSPANVRFSDLCMICDHYFGKARQESGSHRVYKTPWPGDPRVNIQNERGKAKAYQVRQVLKAIRKMEGKHDDAEK
ncbi:MAG TPA: toxin HicA [Deltaproteobacteria bacterium]|nr:toxin HicA [Deltaproteobacteria bacterium]HPR56650.1 toxin HicA [Deltaproteobacteria bacterium]HXK47563.1 toxin HicA [Deltaproteobacteria bacterium]